MIKYLLTYVHENKQLLFAHKGDFFEEVVDIFYRECMRQGIMFEVEILRVWRYDPPHVRDRIAGIA